MSTLYFAISWFNQFRRVKLCCILKCSEYHLTESSPSGKTQDVITMKNKTLRGIIQSLFSHNIPLDIDISSQSLINDKFSIVVNPFIIVHLPVLVSSLFLEVTPQLL